MKSKEGELEAVLNADLGREGVTIVVELLNSTKVTGRVSSKIVRAGVSAVRAGYPLWLDTTWLGDSGRFREIPQGPFEFFDERIESQVEGDITLSHVDVPSLLPVISSNAGESELRSVRMLMEHRPRQIAVRARRPSWSSATALARQLEAIARATGVSVRETHLVVDEGYVDRVDEQRVRGLATCIEVVAQHFELASITLLAGSTPSMRDTYETHFRERPEVELWKAVQADCQRHLRYGDYGVVHPRPASDEGWGWPNPYIHYTVPSRSLFVARRIPDRGRGAPPRGSTERYFLEVAGELVRHSEFAGAEFSWGDRELHNCRHCRNSGVGRSTKWIAMATSHHIAHLSRGRDLRTGD